MFSGVSTYFTNQLEIIWFVNSGAKIGENVVALNYIAPQSTLSHGSISLKSINDCDFELLITLLVLHNLT
jgi:hypothetical protein